MNDESHNMNKPGSIGLVNMKCGYITHVYVTHNVTHSGHKDTK